LNRGKKGFNMLKIYFFMVMVVSGGGCSTYQSAPQQLPNEKMANAKLAINKAETSRAQELAWQELNKARKYLQQAQAAMPAEEYELAVRLAEKSLVEAKQAEAQAEYELAQQALQEIRRRQE
jgi:hypothetical protein